MISFARFYGRLLWSMKEETRKVCDREPLCELNGNSLILLFEDATTTTTIPILLPPAQQNSLAKGYQFKVS